MCNDLIYHYLQCGHTEYVYGLFCRRLYEELNRINNPRYFQNSNYYFRAPAKCKAEEYTILEQLCQECEYKQQMLRYGRGHRGYNCYPRQQQSNSRTGWKLVRIKDRIILARAMFFWYRFLPVSSLLFQLSTPLQSCNTGTAYAAMRMPSLEAKSCPSSLQHVRWILLECTFIDVRKRPRQLKLSSILRLVVSSFITACTL